jgi:phage-related baseplate assembly protein
MADGTTVSADPSAPEYGLDFVPDISFAVKDPAIIESEVITDYQSAFLTLTGIAKTLAPGDPVRLHLLAVCHWLSHQRVLIDFTGKMNLLKYAKEDYLDNLAALHGQRALRLQAQPATTTLRFTLTAALTYGAIIPKGTQCQGPNSVLFETLQDGVIPAGQLTVDVPAQALLEGEIGNGFLPGQVNSIVNWNQPFSLAVTNTTTTAGGSDEETDEQYRYRVWLAIESYSTCGPAQAYEFWALSAHPDIVQAVIHSAPEIAGEVWIYPLMDGGQLPSQEILDAVLAKCSADTVRPVTDYVSVFAPTVVNYSLDMSYYISQNNEVLQASISDAVTQAVNDWILWQRSYVGRDLNCDELVKRCLQAGAKRVVINSPVPSYVVRAYNELAVCDTTAPPADQSFNDGVSTSASPTFTSASAKFAQTDVGLTITGTNIPAGTTILSVQSATSITLSQNATSAGSALAFTIVARVPPLRINYAGIEEP